MEKSRPVTTPVKHVPLRQSSEDVRVQCVRPPQFVDAQSEARSGRTFSASSRADDADVRQGAGHVAASDFSHTPIGSVAVASPVSSRRHTMSVYTDCRSADSSHLQDGRSHSEKPHRDENNNLKMNVQYLRSTKRNLEQQLLTLHAQVDSLHKQAQQYKSLYEKAQRDTQAGSNVMEVDNLRDQLKAVTDLKDQMYCENMDLQRRLMAAQQSDGERLTQAACVVCMDNLANTVCLPCRHLVLCTYCAQQDNLTECPMCRNSIMERIDRKSVV